LASTTVSVQAEQDIVTGPIPLTPIQHWFFEHPIPQPHHWNWAFLHEVRHNLDASLLALTLRYMMRHHDALRLRFQRTDSGWRQVNAGADDAVPFTLIDLSRIPQGEQGRAIESAAAALQTSLHLAEGPLLRVAYFDLGIGQTDRILMLLHHLVVDGISARILLEDLQTVYQQLSRGKAVQLPSKTTSFQYWAQKLTAYAQSPARQAELGYWLANAHREIVPLPMDYPEGRRLNTRASSRTVSVSLSVADTQSLLQEVPAVYHTQINDVLLTALVQALASWTGASSLWVDMEGHGREEIFGDEVDLSRTVGWFTSIYPLLLDLGNTSDPGKALMSIKEQLRAVPNRGIGYGLLRYLCKDKKVTEDLQHLPQPDVSFNYLGQFDQIQPDASPLFAPARESSGSLYHPLDIRRHLLEIIGNVSGGHLQFIWLYSEHVHHLTTIEQVAKSFVEALRMLITHCKSTEVVGFTPSDFSLLNLDQQKLDKILGKIKINKASI
jgi:non-ribosomal peptide synthase protein (TIGR01720 family)